MYIPSLRSRPLGQELLPSVSPTPWVAGAAALVGLVFLFRKRRAR